MDSSGPRPMSILQELDDAISKGSCKAACCDPVVSHAHSAAVNMAAIVRLSAGRNLSLVIS